MGVTKSLLEKWSLVDVSDQNSDTRDVQGHGTMVAGPLRRGEITE